MPKCRSPKPRKRIKASAEEMELIVAGKMRLPRAEISLKQILQIHTGKVRGNRAVEALLSDRNESR